jgi:hypothetical protein
LWSVLEVVAWMTELLLGRSSLRRTGSDMIGSTLRGVSLDSARRWDVSSTWRSGAGSGAVITAVVDTETSREKDDVS